MKTKLKYSVVGFFLLILFENAAGFSNPLVIPKVDKRVELLSIIFRLAGREEYNTQYLPVYTDNIKKHFGSYENHLAVLFAKDMIQKNGVAYDAVMSMAVHLGDAPNFQPIKNFTEDVPDSRWGKKNAEKFTSLVKQFYTDTQAEKFFRDHEHYYSVAERNFVSSLKREVDVSWYSKYYGEVPSGSFNLLIGLGNGSSNYGCKVINVDGREDLYSIIANASPDSLGYATFLPENIQSTIIHEYNHSFINHHTYAKEKSFLPSINKVYEAVQMQMERLHYGSWKIMVNESLVRASEIQYDRMHGATGANILKRIRAEQARGFVWMDKLDSLLNHYGEHRHQYPTFKLFYPKIIEFYKQLSKNASKFVEDYELHCAHVLNIDPLQTEIDSGISQITIYFDKPMDKPISINLSEQGIEHFPFVRSKDSIKWAEDGMSLSLKTSLKADWNYSFILTSLSFRTRDGYPLREKVIEFKTKK